MSAFAGSVRTSTPLGRNDVNSPSPWSSYLILSPAGPSPKGMSTKTTAKSPRLASTQHVLEINPFEESFSSLPVVKTPVRSAVEASMPVARRMSSRKRNPTANAQELDRLAMRDAKRPKLRLGLEDSSTSATTDSTASSFASRSTSISSKATTVSPASSVAPSPEMDTKVDQSKGLLSQLASSVAAAAGPAPFHYQPAPLPINLNSHGHNVPQQSFYPATMAPGSSTFAAFAPDNLSFDGSMTYDSFAALPPASINPVALPQLPIPPPLDLPAAVSEAPVYAPKKRGRKPKGAPVVVDTEADRAAALERNRIAASKSRQRKKERVGNLEMNAQDLAANNALLQKQCLELRAELDSLRALLTQVHPTGCCCEHVNGYLAREKAGGGIPTIERIAGDVLSRDFGRGQVQPSWEATDEAYHAKRNAAAMQVDVDNASGGSYDGPGHANAIPLRRRS